MKAKIQIFTACALACLTSGCIVPGPYYEGRAGVEIAAPYPGEIYVPELLIVEGGVRHDRYFYERHPEYYRRDRMRYPERFAHMPPPPSRYAPAGRGPVPPPPSRGPTVRGPVRPGAVVVDGHQAPPQDSRDKKKKKHHDDDRDR